MSYRHVWGMVQKMEKRLGWKFVETHVGSKEGGRARLTPKKLEERDQNRKSPHLKDKVWFEGGIERWGNLERLR